MTLYLDLLAQVPDSYMYINPFKLFGFVVVFVGWAYFAGWVDKDTIAVNTFRTTWNLIVLGAGVLAAALALFVPMFLVGFCVFIVINLTVMIIYIIHRNGLVQEQDTVLTAAHFKRMKDEGVFGKKKPKEVKERIRLTTADKKVVPIPEEEEEREQYRLTQDLLFDALWHRAQIIEVSATGQATKTVYIVDGMPIERDPLPRAEGEAIIQFVKQMACLDMEEHRKPQTSEIMAAMGDKKQKVSVRTDGSTAGEKLTLRVIGPEANFKAPDLGFTDKQLEAVNKAREELNGLILVSGPARSGLSTTIFSLTRTHDRFLQNVQTIEFVREMPLDNVTQKVFDPTEGKTFTEQLLRLVRADPDVIVLPELRDREAALVAAQAAANKQKVYVGMVANDVFEALRKWISLLGDKVAATKALLAICNQRLVRILCNECKQAYKPDAAMMKKLNLPADKFLYRAPEPQFDKRGNPIVCQACQGTGYVGRTGVFEWLTVDDAMRKVLQTSKSMADIQNYALKQGNVGLQNQALEKVLDGTTSIQEVVRAVRAGAGSRAAKPAATRAKPAGRPKPQAGAGPARKAAGGGAK